MTELKITIDQLKNYLDTGLKATFESDEHEHDFVGLDLTGCGIHLISAFGDFGSAWIKDLRPICYRLSDLDKFIPELRFVPLDELYFEAGHQRPAQNNGGMMLWNKSMFETILHAIPSELSYGVISKLFQWHFWPFGDEYFEAGLVIDKLKQTTNEK